MTNLFIGLYGLVQFSYKLALRPAETSEGIRSRMARVAMDITHALIFILAMMCDKFNTVKDVHSLK